MAEAPSPHPNGPPAFTIVLPAARLPAHLAPMQRQLFRAGCVGQLDHPSHRALVAWGSNIAHHYHVNVPGVEIKLHDRPTAIRLQANIAPQLPTYPTEDEPQQAKEAQ